MSTQSATDVVTPTDVDDSVVINPDEVTPPSSLVPSPLETEVNTMCTVLTSFDGDDGINPLGTITATERIVQEKMMYNLTVDTAHTFFVGEGEWLMHN
jgi:hypothetical protein